MYDIHSHILPDIDDGAKNIKEAIEIGRIAEKEGITHMIATPHFSYATPDFKGIIRERVVVLNQIFKAENVGVKIYPGTEAFVTPELLKCLEKKDFLSLNDTNYILVEFPLREVPLYAEEFLYRIRLMGKKPIIAHPERYKEVMEDPNIVKKWVEQGNYIQVNATSIMGVSGSRVQRTAKHLFAHQMVHLLATDAHSPRNRSPRLTEAKEMAGKWCGKKELAMILRNSERVFNDEELIIKEPLQYPYGYNLIQRIHTTLRK